jgi:peptidyl-prolyl cis-trans isomerase B (cyclophilin B)
MKMKLVVGMSLIAVMGLASGAFAQGSTAPASTPPAATTPAGDKPATTTPATTTPATTTPPGSTPKSEPAGKSESSAKEQPVFVQLRTNQGNITLELNKEKAPISVENFLKYVDKGHYAGTIFHRVIKGFMIQGGGFDANMKQKEVDKPIKNEGGNGLKNAKYTVAMARTSIADSATSQFYINVADNAFLDRANSRDGVGYAVFGKVVAGMDVVDKIAQLRTAEKGGMGDVPVETVTITEAVRLTAEQAEAAVKAAPAK